MLAYSIIMFLGAMILVGMGIAIYRGKTDLIHDYHQTNELAILVNLPYLDEPAGYGRVLVLPDGRSPANF